MSPRRVFALALGTQGLLIVAAWLISRAMNITTPWGDPMRDTAIGLAAAVALAAGNYALLVHAPGNWLVNGVRAVYDDVLVPLFASLSRLSIVVLGAAAGIGEEWLFRGVVQPAIGLLGASVAFGLAHVGGLRMLPFGIWAAAMGLVMGTLAIATNGLVAPIVAHGVYDMLALAYIRRGAHNE
ncbi:MAG: lysostaphin resistance A-like protein [Vicinamibacterales bacterium]